MWIFIYYIRPKAKTVSPNHAPIKGNYGKNKAEFQRIVLDAKDKRFNNSLTTPQQKAIENKKKIDTLFNQILSN